eukprot:scaffold3847_cov106-Cylindrotheca_fusiformis.AAC.3
MVGGSSLRTPDRIVQSGETEDNDPSNVLINAIPVNEIEEHRGTAMPQEMVSAVVMLEDDRASLAAGLSRSDDTKTADDVKRASLLRDSVDDAMPWGKKDNTAIQSSGLAHQ